jgi:murein DD-endopeptidase MepM/ murein hydrolase activator NlpD
MISSSRKRIIIKTEKREKRLKPYFQGVFKNLFCANGGKICAAFKKIGSYSLIFVILTFLVVAVFLLKPLSKSLSIRNFSFLAMAQGNGVDNKDSGLFAEPAKNFLRDSSEMCLIGDNSAMAVCPTDVITPRVLGSIAEDIDSDIPRDGIIDYEIGPDDTISSIAEKFGISVNTILWANNISSTSKLTSGQTLTILPVSGVMHMVKDGDTLSVIAGTYKADVKEIIAFNNLKDEQDIYIGDILVVPGGVITPKAKKQTIPDIPTADAYFIIPVEGKISQGPHGPYGSAIDIANSCGSPVVAAAGGKVQRVGMIPVGGNIITILHPNGVVTYYGHLSSMIVSSGQSVSAGQIIGYVGRTGYATGCHVHFEVRGGKNFMAKYSVGSMVSWRK